MPLLMLPLQPSQLVAMAPAAAAAAEHFLQSLLQQLRQKTLMLTTIPQYPAAAAVAVVWLSASAAKLL
jgi:hypothetical protein